MEHIDIESPEWVKKERERDDVEEYVILDEAGEEVYVFRLDEELVEHYRNWGLSDEAIEKGFEHIRKTHIKREKKV